MIACRHDLLHRLAILKSASKLEKSLKLQKLVPRLMFRSIYKRFVYCSCVGNCNVFVERNASVTPDLLIAEVIKFDLVVI